MTKATKQIVSQSEFQKGRIEGTRYQVDGHQELLSNYENGSADYRIGWDISTDEMQKRDPHYAS